jgi:calcium permeable stress-gated cation channel
VDTINWTRIELARLNPEIVKQQNEHTSNKQLNSAFITFTSLAAAHRAAQIKLPEKKHVPFKLERTLAPKPAEVIWSNMRINYPERIGRFTATTAFVTVMIIFWAIPVAFVGSISNINYLTNKVGFLKFILDIPPVILGVVTGLLPSIMLAVLMALLPIILRCMPSFYQTNISNGKTGRCPYFFKSGTLRSKYLFPVPGMFSFHLYNIRSSKYFW